MWRESEDVNRKRGIQKNVSGNSIGIFSYWKVTSPVDAGGAATGSTGAGAASAGAAGLPSPGFCPSLHPSPP